MHVTRRPDARGLAALILGASLLGFAAMLVRSLYREGTRADRMITSIL